jgi:hypothetical protein
MMGGVSSETCWEIKKHWNNKFYYTVASCWFFLWDLYYDARIHEHQALYTFTVAEVINYAQVTSTFLATLVTNHCSMQRVWENSWSVLKFPFYLNREDVQNGRYIDWINLPLTSLDKEFDQFSFYISYYQKILLSLMFMDPCIII